MPLYRYKAVAASGEIREDQMEARDEGSVVARLQALGHVPIRVEPAGALSVKGLLGLDLLGRPAYPQRELALFARQVSTLLHAGMPLDRALQILIDLAQRAGPRQILGRVLESLRGGASLADSLGAQEGVFPRFFISLVRAGEAGGNLDQVLARLAEYLERMQAVRETVRSALLYPMIVLLLSGLSLVVMFTVVLPQFRPMFEGAGAGLPTLTRIVLAVGDAVEAYGWLALIALALLALLIQRRRRDPTARARLDAVLLKLPLVGGLIARAEVARLSRTLGTLLANGLPIVLALGISREAVRNAVIGQAIDAVAQDVKTGKGLADQLARTGVVPPLAIHLIRVGEEAGRLDEMLMKVADIFEGEVKQSIDRLLALLVPALTVALGVVVAVIIGSVLMAILSVYDLAV